MSAEIRFLLVDDHLVVRKGVELIILNAFPNAKISFAENYDDALESIKSRIFDLVILDININGIENIKIMNSIKEIQRNIKILIFSSHEEKHYGTRYISNGADGYLNKFCSEEKISEAITIILNKGFFYSDKTKNEINSKLKLKNKNDIDCLSNREFEIANLLVSGEGNLEIANKLDLKMSTISTYKNRIYHKLNISSVVALAQVFKNFEK